MKKKIIITAGPTNERIDSVMKITNMSTGSMGCNVAETFLEDKENEIEKIFFISTQMTYKPKIESSKIDIMIHSAAVGDYTGKYSIRAEDLVDEILEVIKNNDKEEITKEKLMNIFEKPKAVADNSGKMSSNEPHLMTMLTLTPKVISLIKKNAPDITLVGFKLLDGVSKEKLLSVASNLRNKNDADYIVANDLSKIGDGKHWAMIVGENGVICECQTKKEIAKEIEKLVF